MRGGLLLVLACVAAACTNAGKDDGTTEQQPVNEHSALAEGDDDCGRTIADGAVRIAAIRRDEALSPPEKDIAIARVVGKGGRCWLRSEPRETLNDISDDLARRYTIALDAARSADGEGECRSAIGDENADALEAICMQVSGATHPPCNAANSCTLLVGEVDRNCVGGMVRDYPKLCSGARDMGEDR